MSRSLTSRSNVPHLLINVSPGELLDRITILELKAARLQGDAAQRARQQLAALERLRAQRVSENARLPALLNALREVNRFLWDIENDIRICEKDGDFGLRFIRLARAVYQQNDKRTAIKERINRMLGSIVGEEKCYSA